MNQHWNNVGSALMWLLSGIFYILTTVIVWFFKGVFAVVAAVVASLDFGGLVVNAAASWGFLDSNLAWMISACGISQGMTMLGYAFIIRLTLNLIPASVTRV